MGFSRKVAREKRRQVKHWYVTEPNLAVEEVKKRLRQRYGSSMSPADITKCRKAVEKQNSLSAQNGTSASQYMTIGEMAKQYQLKEDILKRAIRYKRLPAVLMVERAVAAQWVQQGRLVGGNKVVHSLHIQLGQKRKEIASLEQRNKQQAERIAELEKQQQGPSTTVEHQPQQ